MKLKYSIVNRVVEAGDMFNKLNISQKTKTKNEKNSNEWKCFEISRFHHFINVDIRWLNTDMVQGIANINSTHWNHFKHRK